MLRLIFDLETNGLLDELDTVHCLCMKDLLTEKTYSLSEHLVENSVRHGVHLLMQADEVIGHNIIKFDIPALQKVYPWFKLKDTCVITDTLTLARFLIPDIADRDYGLAKQGKLPKKLIGRYSLESFGYRLGEYKGDYKGGWEHWSQEMQDYCDQDIVVTDKLYANLMLRIEKQEIPQFVVDLEHDVQKIILRQENNGFGFDSQKAGQLYQELLLKRIELEKALKLTFPPWEVRTPFVPKVNNKTRGYVKGVMTYKSQIIEFNPGSRQHIAKVLKEKYGWVPKDFTDKGEAKVDDSVLSSLPWPEAKLLAEYFMIQKRLGQIAEGGEGLMKRERNGRIHGEVITNGAVTGRMTHRKPNMAQIPANYSPYGKQFRELFIPRPGWLLIGCDADALELRCLAHYMATYDGGEYIETVLRGDKSKGTDMHSQNCRAIGLDPTKMYPVDGIELSGRDIAKTWFYAFIYGAGDVKLGTIILGGSADIEVAKRAGTKSRKSLLKNLPALGRIVEKVKVKVMATGALRGIDGRRLACRSAHSAFNTLLQSAGAIAMKVALVELDRTLQANGLIPGKHYEFCANVHDEWQIEALPQQADFVGTMAASSIARAGEILKFKCPLAGNFEIGNNWKETH